MERIKKMTRKRTPLSTVPNWFLEIVGVMHDVDHGLRNIETEVRYAAGLKDLDSRLRSDMLRMSEALVAVKGNLAAMDRTAKQLLRELSDNGCRKVEFAAK
jgi:hypothetical protein